MFVLLDDFGRFWTNWDDFGRFWIQGGSGRPNGFRIRTDSVESRTGSDGFGRIPGPKDGMRQPRNQAIWTAV